MVTRRTVLRAGLTTVATVSGTTGALWPVLAAGQPGGDGWAVAARGVGDAPAPLFDEVYRGRRIQGYTTTAESGVEILVDGRPLHVMRRVDGSWISMANHFQPYLTPLATARGAVDAIGGAELSSDPGIDHHH
jgi:hypothetical protein